MAHQLLPLQLQQLRLALETASTDNGDSSGQLASYITVISN